MALNKKKKGFIKLIYVSLKYGAITPIFVLIFSASVTAQIRYNHNPSLCPYTEQEKIFVGIFQKQTYKKDIGKKGSSIAEFSIKQALKGINQNDNEISAVSGVYANRLQIGETYLVFLIYDETIKKYIITAPFPVVFLNNTSINAEKQKNFKLQNEFQIAFGDFNASNLEDLKIFKTEINSNNKTYSPKFVDGGVFTIVFHNDIKVNVSIETKADADALVNYGNSDTTIKTEANKTTILYELKPSDYGCDYRQFNFFKKDNKQQ